MFIVSSKTFTTTVTLATANAARRWLTAAQGEDAVSHHFVAVPPTRLKWRSSVSPGRENIFEFWDWPGGRHSVGSAIGSAVIMTPGPDAFSRFLAGMHIMHRTSPRGDAGEERARSVAARDPFRQMWRLGPDGGGVSVTGMNPSVFGQREQPVADGSDNRGEI